MVAPRALARFNRHVTNPVLSRIVLRMPGFAMIVHTGRRSGKEYRTPVNVFRADDGYLIALTYGPGSDWVRNVLAAGGCDAIIRGTTVHLTEPHVLNVQILRAVQCRGIGLHRVGGAVVVSHQCSAAGVRRRR